MENKRSPEELKRALEAKRKADRAMASKRNRGNTNASFRLSNPGEPGLSKLLYLLASLSLIAGVIGCFLLWPSGGGPASAIEAAVSIAALIFGVSQFAVLAGFGSVLAYLKKIAENTGS